MHRVLAFELESGTIPAYVKDNVGCEIRGVYVGVGTPQIDSKVFYDEASLVSYLEQNNYGTGWGPRADGSTPVFDAAAYAAAVFARCADLANA